MTKNIETKTISVAELKSDIDNKKLSKPGFQRKAKWEKLPRENTKVPNKKDYISFLNKTEHSGDLIHIAILPNNTEACNIDGNNRITSILGYMNKPFDLFPEYLSDIDKWINNLNFIIDKTDNENNENKLKEILINFFQNLTYYECKYFDYKKKLEEKYDILYNTYFMKYRDDFENTKLDKLIIEKIKTINGNFLDDKLKIAVNYYYNYSEEETGEIYLSLNQYKNGGITHQELAEGEYDQIFIDMCDKNIEFKIKEHIKNYYKLKNENEIMECYEYNDGPLNFFQILTGFQIFCNKNYNFIPEYKGNSKKQELFFKLYFYEYNENNIKNINIKNINNNNVDEFIKNIMDCCNILKNVFSKILPDKGIFKKLSKLFILNENNYVLLINIIVSLKNKTIDKSTIEKEIEKIILYHNFCKNITDDEQNDCLKYVSSGRHIPDTVKKIKTKPTNFIQQITKDDFKKKLNNILNEYSPKNRYRENSKNEVACNKRRIRGHNDLILLNYYCQYNLSLSLIDNEFEFEHLIPFSSKWKDEVDIENLGNIIPIFKYINKKRGTKHINEYLDIVKDDIKGQHLMNNFYNIFDIVKKNYDNIIDKENKTPSIKNNTLYKDQCYNIRNIYIDTFINKLYN